MLVYLLLQKSYSQGVALKGDELNADMLAVEKAEVSNMDGGKALKTGAEHTAHIFKNSLNKTYLGNTD